MINSPPEVNLSPQWSPEAISLAAQAKILSGAKLEQLVLRIQKRTGRSNEACWRFVIQRGIKAKPECRRWSEEEIEFVREELVRRSIDEIAAHLGRTPRSVWNMLSRNQLSVSEIRCDRFSLASLSRALHVGRSEILFWVQQGWLDATHSVTQGRHFYRFSPEALMRLYKHHLTDLLRRGLPNYSLFEAYVQYLYSPKHTVGEQLLQVRRDKRERAAFAAVRQQETCEDDESDELPDESRFAISSYGGCDTDEDLKG